MRKLTRANYLLASQVLYGMIRSIGGIWPFGGSRRGGVTLNK